VTALKKSLERLGVDQVELYQVGRSLRWIWTERENLPALRRTRFMELPVCPSILMKLKVHNSPNVLSREWRNKLE
jgi:hypothetical protein